MNEIVTKLWLYLKSKTKDKTMQSDVLDLLNEAVYQIQLNNATAFNKKSFAGKVGFFMIPGSLALLIFLEKIFGIQLENQYPVLFFILIAASLFLGVLGTIFYAKCPNCNSLQPGKYYSFSFAEGGFTAQYGKGVSPFAKRCIKCQCYLSVKQLEKDKGLQTEASLKTKLNH